ncbi:MAG: nucleoside recognition domain-containing protein [Clostridium sp.]|nr:nucleoside recognition domain-containing protein [Clostridium sp.]CCZ18328.1 nucleoside recognition domain protein [Clostridium sp. CAG:780]
MLNKIWPAFLIISFIYAILNGNIEEFNNSIFTSCAQTVDLILKLFGTMCLWNGLMKIVQETSLMKKLTKIISPLMKILFPKMKKEDKEYKEITINIIANLLGIGNAATPLGLKAMQTMQEKNPQKDRITDSMAMFIVLNTASIQLIPSTVIAVRASLGSVNPSQIIVPVWIATIAADVAGIIASKMLMKKF